MWSFNKVPTYVSVLKFLIEVMCLALFSLRYPAKQKLRMIYLILLRYSVAQS